MSNFSSSSTLNNDDAFLDEVTREFFEAEQNILENHLPHSSSSSSLSSSAPSLSSTNTHGSRTNGVSSTSSNQNGDENNTVDTESSRSSSQPLSSSSNVHTPSSSSSSSFPSSSTSSSSSITSDSVSFSNIPTTENNGNENMGHTIAGEEGEQAEEGYIDPEQVPPYPQSVRPLRPEREKVDGSVTDNNTIERNPDLSNACKEEGNRHFGKGNYELAISCYTEGLRLLPRTPEYYPKLAIIYANRAASYLFLGSGNSNERYEDAVYDCDRALELKPDYVKALARRASALEKLTQYDEAVKDLQAWIDLEPNERKPKQELERLNILIKERDQKLKDEMLGKLKDLGNSILGKFGLSLDNFKAVQDPSSGSYSISFQK